MAVKQIQGYTIYLKKVLGHGSFGSVYKGIREKNKEEVAVKIILKQQIDNDEYLKQSLRNQIQILQSVQSQNIVGFYDVMESAKNYYIVQELCDGDLSQFIRLGKQLPEDYCIDALRQICNGFLALLKEGIIHRDLKPANILYRNKTFKIGDFGFSKQIDNELRKLKTTVGTPLYMSLEILKSEQYTSKCDIWALGFIFYEMLHGFTPWTANRQYQLVQSILTTPLNIKRKDLSTQTIDFLQKCLRIYQKDRISWDQIYLHPIFKGYFQSFANQNQEFQNQLKTIMTKIKIYIYTKNQNLSSIISSFGQGDEELDFDQFSLFLKTVCPGITKSQIMYVFKKTDVDGSLSISISEIEEMLKKHSISLNLGKNTHQTQKQQGNLNTLMMTVNSETKMRHCFVKLYKIIARHKLSLKKVFNDFDKNKKGKLVFEQFKFMLQKLSKDISDEEAYFAFKAIDDDNSQSIEYSELQKHYQKMNNLPLTIEESLQSSGKIQLINGKATMKKETASLTTVKSQGQLKIHSTKSGLN